jgi:cell division protein ZapE
MSVAEASPSVPQIPVTGKGPLAALEARLAAGIFKPDPRQREVAERLQGLWEKLKGIEPVKQSSGGFLARLGFGRKPTPAAGPPGLYIWGPVGTGKSMVMDLFFNEAPVEQKRRAHFHEFMLEVHRRLFERRQMLAAKGAPPEADVIVPVAREIAQNARLLCFDEMQVTNIADAMILWRLFATLFEEGVTVVTTSNRVPDDLYKNGLQRDRFQPFIDLLKAKLEIHTLDTGRDYRMARLREMDKYLVPAGPWADRKLPSACCARRVAT